MSEWTGEDGHVSVRVRHLKRNPNRFSWPGLGGVPFGSGHLLSGFSVCLPERVQVYESTVA